MTRGQRIFGYGSQGTRPCKNLGGEHSRWDGKGKQETRSHRSL